MPVFQHVQTRFLGEVSPKMLGRVDLEVVQNGLAYCENFIPRPHGSLEARNGFEWIDTPNADLMEHAAEGSITVGTEVNGDTVVIDGSTLTVAAAAANESEVTHGATPADTATNLAAKINAHSVISTKVTAAVDGAVTTKVNLTSIAKTSDANGLTLAETGTTFTISGATLTGGYNQNLLRLLPMSLAGRQDAIVALGHLKARIYQADGGEVSSGVEAYSSLYNAIPPWVRVVARLIGTTHWFPRWVTYGTTYLEICSLSRARIALTVPTSGEWRVSFRAQRRDPDSYTPSDSVYRVRVGTVPGGGDLLDEVRPCRADPYRVWVEIVRDLAVVAGTIYVDIEGADPGHLDPYGDPTSSPDYFFDNFSVRALGAQGLVSPWSGAQLGDVQFVEEPSKDRSILAHGEVETQVLACADYAAGTWSLLGITDASFSLTGKPAEWAAANWPSAVEIAVGRLWLASTPGARNKFWASRPGNLFDFGQDSPVDADSAIINNVATKGAIRWLRGQKALLCGTDIGEHSFVAQAGVLQQGDIDARPESAFGSAAEMAAHAGNKVLFTSTDRRKVRALGYDLQTSGWVQADLTFPAEHLTFGGISELHFGRDPHGSIIGVVAGQIVAATYDEAAQTLAWWRLTTRGTVISAAVSNGPDGSMLWAAIERSTGVQLERLWLSEHGTLVALDSKVMKIVEADGRITGLAHLEGETVDVVIGTAVVQGLAVAGGAVQLDVEFAGDSAVVGLPLPAIRAVTLPPEGGNPRGTAMGTARRRTKTYLRLNNSALPLVNGDRAPDRRPSTPMDEGEPLFTGDVECNGGDYSTRGQVTIEQDLPLRTEILAVFGPVQVNDV